MEEKNIIAIRKVDVHKANQAFDELMGITQKQMNEAAIINPACYQSLTAHELEITSLNAIKSACKDTPFNPDNIALISGQRFPDIVAEKYYGVEVKSTKSDSWKSTGSSIVESTRDINVENIYMLFGKLGGKIPQFKCRPYHDVLYDITVTHSPRYLIDMELTTGTTIFDKMATTYDDFRKSGDSINIMRRYYQEIARNNHKQEMPWWLTSENLADDNMINGGINVRLWSGLGVEEKNWLTAMILVLFPETMHSNYENAALWLCSYYQVVNHCMRDLYTAGGKISHVNGQRLQKPVKHLYATIVELAPMIKTLLRVATLDMALLLQDYNPVLSKSKDKYEMWIKCCEQIAQKDNVPIRKWINERPIFSFSK